MFNVTVTDKQKANFPDWDKSTLALLAYVLILCKVCVMTVYRSDTCAGFSANKIINIVLYSYMKITLYKVTNLTLSKTSGILLDLTDLFDIFGAGNNTVL